jgi:transposase
MAVEFIPIDRDTPYIFPPSVQDYLPDDHLARFVVDIVEQLDLSHLSAVYSGRGSKPFHSALLVALLMFDASRKGLPH